MYVRSAHLPAYPPVRSSVTSDFPIPNLRSVCQPGRQSSCSSIHLSAPLLVPPPSSPARLTFQFPIASLSALLLFPSFCLHISLFTRLTVTRSSIRSSVLPPVRPTILLSVSLSLPVVSVCPPVLLFTHPLVCPLYRPLNIRCLLPARGSIIDPRALINILSPVAQPGVKKAVRFNDFKLF